MSKQKTLVISPTNIAFRMDFNKREAVMEFNDGKQFSEIRIGEKWFSRSSNEFIKGLRLLAAMLEIGPKNGDA
jgi:hypothetical protein